MSPCAGSLDSLPPASMKIPGQKIESQSQANGLVRWLVEEFDKRRIFEHDAGPPDRLAQRMMEMIAVHEEAESAVRKLQGSPEFLQNPRSSLEEAREAEFERIHKQRVPKNASLAEDAQVTHEILAERPDLEPDWLDDPLVMLVKEFIQSVDVDAVVSY